MARLGRGPAVLTRRGGGRALDPRSYALSTSTMRNMIAAQIDPVDGAGGPGGLAVASTHLATRTGTAAAQLAAAWAALAALPGPHVLAGDLNLHAELLAPLGIARGLGEGATYPSGAPARRIDHILTSRAMASALQDVQVDYDTRALERPSDHAPVWAQFADCSSSS